MLRVGFLAFFSVWLHVAGLNQVINSLEKNPADSIHAQAHVQLKTQDIITTSFLSYGEYQSHEMIWLKSDAVSYFILTHCGTKLDSAIPADARQGKVSFNLHLDDVIKIDSKRRKNQILQGEGYFEMLRPLIEQVRIK